MSESKHLHFNVVGNTNGVHDKWPLHARKTGVMTGQESTLDLYLEYAKLAEEALCTSLFLGDTASAMSAPLADGGAPEPVSALTAVAAATTHLGLVATMSTTFYEPYNVARLIGSLDQLSGGRAGFNAVTSASDSAALNFNYDAHLSRDDRYAIADEFLDVVRGLWDNRELRTNEEGITQYFGTALNHQSDAFKVRGPLNVAPAFNGISPLISQAGGSGPGVRVGARHADVIFTNANSKADALDHRAQLEQALSAVGRAARSVPVLPGVVPYLGKTRAEALERREELDSHLDYEAMAPHALAAFGIQYTFDDLDERFPAEVLPDPALVRDKIKNSYGNYLGLYTWASENPDATVRQMIAQVAGGWTHRKFIGTYDEFVDDLQDWFDTGAADGFSLFVPRGTATLREIRDEIVPRLIDRGIYRSTPDVRPLKLRFS